VAQQSNRSFGSNINKHDVRQIFQDLEAWCNYCRFRMIKYDPADLYRSPEYKEWQERRKKRQQWQARNGIVYNKQNRGQ
jgi:hypothetical protein